MATQTRFPTSDQSDGAWTPSTGADLYACIDEAVQDDSDYISCATNNNNTYFNHSAFTIPAGSTINSVKVYCTGHETGSTQITGILRINGSVTVNAGQNITNSTPWQVITTTWTTNPDTGSAWTVDDVNGSGSHPLQNFGISSRSIGAGEVVDCSWCYCEVDYTPGGTTDTLTPAAASFTLTGLVPGLRTKVYPTILGMTLTGLAPGLRVKVAPAAFSLVWTGLAPVLRTTLHPAGLSLTLTGLAPTLRELVHPGAMALTLTGGSSVLRSVVHPDPWTLTWTGLVSTLVVTGGAVIEVLSPAPWILTFRGMRTILRLRERPHGGGFSAPGFQVLG